MSDIVDHAGNLLFTDEFDHTVHDADDRNIDVIITNRNIWLSGPAVLDAMGFSQHKSGGHSRRLKRIAYPDIIKISDTPFRFSDNRRNKGSLISPRAVMKFAAGGPQGFNPFKALPFVEWMKDQLLPDGGSPDDWSPAYEEPVSLQPVFHSVSIASDENEAGEPLDPFRPVGVYAPLHDGYPLGKDEVEFCLCTDERTGVGRCWCNGKGRIRDMIGAAFKNDGGDEIIDHDDDFSPFSSWAYRAALAA